MKDRLWPTAGGHEQPLRRSETRRIQGRRRAALERAVGRVWVGTRQTACRGHRRRGVVEAERPRSSRSRLGGLDPNLPAGLLQSSRTASHRFSCLTSTKRPFVITRTRPQADVGDRQLPGIACHRGHCRSNPKLAPERGPAEGCAHRQTALVPRPRRHLTCQRSR